MKKEYPIYLKYPNDDIFIEIVNEDEWEEIRYIGAVKTINSFKTQIFSDKVYLNDLIEYVDQGLLMSIDSLEYQKHRK